MRTPRSVVCLASLPQAATLYHEVCSDTRGVTPVYRCTCAASEIFSNGSRGTPGWENTLKRVPELPNAQVGTSTVNSAKAARTPSARDPGDTPGAGAVPAVIVVLLSAAPLLVSACA